MRRQDRFLHFQVLCVVHPMFLGLHTENVEACKGLWFFLVAKIDAIVYASRYVYIYIYK